MRSRRRRTVILAALAIPLLFQLSCIDGITVGFSVFAIIALWVPGGQGVAGAAFIGQCAGMVVLGMAESFAQAPSHPDPDFAFVANVEPVHFDLPDAGLPSGDAVPSSIHQSVIVAGKLIDDSRRLNLSLRKYYGAVAASSTAGAHLQKSAACRALNDLNADLQAYSAALYGISAEIQETPVASISVTVEDVLELRDQIVTTGSFPENEASLFAQANVSPEELSQAVAAVARVTSESIADDDLQGSVIFSRAAQEIDQVDVSAFLPQGFTCNAAPIESVPTLSQWGVILMALLLAASSLYISRRARHR